MGLRSLEEVSSVSFVAAVESVVPAFWGEQGVCPQLEEVVGGWYERLRAFVHLCDVRLALFFVSTAALGFCFMSVEGTPCSRTSERTSSPLLHSSCHATLQCMCWCWWESVAEARSSWDCFRS